MSALDVREPALAPERRRLRVVAVTSYAAVLASWITVVGIPGDPLMLSGWLWLGAIAWRIDEPARSHLRFARDWAAPLGFLLLYAYSYGLIYRLHLPVHYGTPIAFDRWLGFGTTLPERLQHWTCGGACTSAGGTPVDTLLSTVYFSHFVLAWVLMAILWLRDRGAWLCWSRRFVTANMIGLVVYVAFPMAPPWLASQRGLIGPVSVSAGRGWFGLGLHLSGALRGPLVNPVAAMPSLHVATATLVALFGIQRLRGRWRWGLVGYPVTMAFALLYFGLHYTLDELAGATLGVLVHLAWTRWERSSHPIEA